MTTIPFASRLAGAGATNTEIASIDAAFVASPAENRHALDELIRSIDNTSLQTMLGNWRNGDGPFGAGFPFGGLPFGTHAAVLTGNPADDAKAIGGGTGVLISPGGSVTKAAVVATGLAPSDIGADAVPTIQGSYGTNLSATQTINFASIVQEIWLVGAVNTNLTVTVQNPAAGARALLLLNNTSASSLAVSDGTTTQSVPIASSGFSAVLIDCPDSSTILVSPVSVPGPTGNTGLTGSTGPTGSRGSAWFIYTGSGTPTGLTGMINGDFAIRTSDAEIYEFVSGAWTDQGFTIGIPAAVTQTTYNAIMPWTVGFQLPSIVTDPATVTGTWVQNHSTTSAQLETISNSTVAQNDAIGWDIALSAGTWDFAISGPKTSGSGINTVTLDGSTIATVDLYNSTTLFNQVSVTTGITVPSNGKHRLLFTAATKNASSSGFSLQMSSFMMRRTA